MKSVLKFLLWVYGSIKTKGTEGKDSHIVFFYTVFSL